MNIESIKIFCPKPISIARPLSTTSSNSSITPQSIQSITPEKIITPPIVGKLTSIHELSILIPINRSPSISNISPSISHTSPLINSSLSLSPSLLKLNTPIITNIHLENSRSCVILPHHIIINKNSPF